MKKHILKLSVFFLFAALLTSCNAEDTVLEDATVHSAKRGGFWDGIIGVDNGGGNYQITADASLLLASLEEQLLEDGDTVSLQTIDIQKRTAANDANDTGYLLIAGDKAGTSIGVMLTLGANSTFKVAANPGVVGFEDPKSISCRGCESGCNLEYFNMPGGKVPYCNTNGCGDYCTEVTKKLK
jgi:hypothetical protein